MVNCFGGRPEAEKLPTRPVGNITESANCSFLFCLGHQHTTSSLLLMLPHYLSPLVLWLVVGVLVDRESSGRFNFRGRLTGQRRFGSTYGGCCRPSCSPSGQLLLPLCSTRLVSSNLQPLIHNGYIQLKISSHLRCSSVGQRATVIA